MLTPIVPLATQSFASFQFADGTSLTWEELLQRGFDIDGTEGKNDPLRNLGVDWRPRNTQESRRWRYGDSNADSANQETWRAAA